MQSDKFAIRYATPSLDGSLSGPVFKAVYGDKQIGINISRNTLFAIIFSLLLHTLILFVIPKIELDTPPASPPTTIDVTLTSLKPAIKVVEVTPEVAPEQPKEVKPKIVKSKIMAQKPTKTPRPTFKVPEVLTTTEPAPDKMPTKDSVTAEPPVKELPIEEQYTDMAAYVKAMQAKRQGTEVDAARQNAEAVAREQGPTEAQLRDERIKRNFQNGTNGIFEITSLSSRNATFAFRGWTTDYSSSRQQYFEVEVKGGQDVRLVMIRRMIGLIREHYQGDFNWESHRIGRSVVQSARLEDNAGLEDFLMMEFFGTNYKKTQ